MQVRVSVVSISILFIIPRLTHSCSISFLESTLLSLIVTQNQPLSRHKHKARGSNGIDTSGLDKQIEEKRLRDAQIVQQEKQEGRSWNDSTIVIHSHYFSNNKLHTPCTSSRIHVGIQQTSRRLRSCCQIQEEPKVARYNSDA